MDHRCWGLLLLAGCAVPYDPGFDDTDTEVVVDTETDADTDTDTVEGPLVLVPSDSCAVARDLDPLGAGVYAGTFTELTASGLEPRCPAMAVPVGIDGYTRVEVPAGATIDVRFDVRDVDSAVFLMRSCASATACVVGSDRYYAGEPEVLTYENTTTEPGVVILGMAVVSATDAGGPFDLTVALTVP